MIIEEIKMYHDDPKMYVVDKIKELSYKKPFGASGIGTVETLGKMTKEELLDIHEQNYTPENSILAVVGNNDFSEILKLAEKIKKTGEKSANESKVDRITEEKIEKRKGIEQVCLILSIPSVTDKDKLRYAALAFKTIIGGGMSSRLFKEIREKRGLAYAVKSLLDTGKEFGNLLFYVGTEKGKEEEVKKVILEEIKKMKNITEKEVKEVKEQLIGNHEIAEEDSRNVCFSLILEEMVDKAEEHYKFVDRIKEIKLEDVKKFADIKEYSFIALIPE